MKYIVFVLVWISHVNAAGYDGLQRIPEDKLWLKRTKENERMTEEFGQISAVTVDKNGLLYLFHRAMRQWDQNTFLTNNHLKDEAAGPIHWETIVVLHPNGDAAAATGRDRFYMPHGLTVDEELNLWTTDVGLHQVMKFPPIKSWSPSAKLDDPLLTLGTPVTPGKNRYLFCKPTSVAIDEKSKDFFVADGYCNSRIVKYNQKGQYLTEWGKPTFSNPFMPIGKRLGPFNLQVPHSLSIDTTLKRLIVADRENSRILFYSFDGVFRDVLSTQGRVYGVTYSTVTDSIYAVTGSSLTGPGVGMVYSIGLNNATARFGEFENAHDVAVSTNGSDIYVVETQPFKMWRFTVDNIIVGSEPEEAKVRRVNPVGSPPEKTEEVDVSTGDVTSNLVSQEGGGGFDAGASLGANQIALSVVTIVVLLAVVSVMCHLRRRKGHSIPMERRGLILDDDE